MASRPFARPSTGPPPSTNIQTRPRAVQITSHEVQPMVRGYMQDEDSLQFFVIANFAGAQVIFNVRYLSPDGEIRPGQIVVTAPTAGVLVQFPWPVTEGFLLSVSATCPAAISIGQWVWVSVAIFRGTGAGQSVSSVILDGYVTGHYSPSWPEWQPQRPTDGPGVLRSITGSAPAAGAQISEVVPTGRKWQLLSFRAGLTTSAAVANRLPQFNVLDNGSRGLLVSQSNQNQAASLTLNYQLAAFGTPNALNQTEVTIPGVLAFPLSAGYIIQTQTIAMQAADQWSAPQYLVYEWLDFI